MIITIFGATGMVGRQLVKQALYNGDSVRAFGRNVYTVDFPENEKLELIQGALFEEKQVHDAIAGADAVISVLGGSTDGSDHTRSLGMKRITEQMKIAGVSRIVGLGGPGVLPQPNGQLMMDQPNFPPEFLPVSREHLKALEYLQKSGLEWTFVCPPMIKDAGETGEFKTAADANPVPNKFYINSGDLALFMLKELKDKKYLDKRVGISN